MHISSHIEARQMTASPLLRLAHRQLINDREPPAGLVPISRGPERQHEQRSALSK